MGLERHEDESMMSEFTFLIMAPSKMKLRVRKKESGGRSSQRLLANASPDSKCPICLDSFKNMASLDRCLHRFCFRCIHEWSKNKAECPLCKQPFHSIFHSVKGENDFKEFVLRPAENLAPNGAAAGRVLRPRVLRGRERRSRRLQQPAPSSPPPVDDDVMFGGLTDAAAFTDNQGLEQMVMRLRARRRGHGESRRLRRLRDQDVVAFRRALYRTGVRVRNTRDVGRQREVSAAYLRQNPTCLHRLLPWLQRELTVLYGSHGSLVNIVQHIIMSRITNYNMEDSAIRDELRPFLLARTDHFLHELVSFARSTLSMEAYDQQAIYDCPAPSYEEGSSSDDSVIAISEDDDDDNNDSEDNVIENPSIVQEHLLSIPTASGTESLLSQSAWDDETPGPSYSTLLPSSSLSQDEGVEPGSSTALVLNAMKMTDPAASASVSARPGEDDEEECLIVGYVKPMAERTPELVQLSSDSSEEEQEAAATDAMATVTKSETSQVQAPSQSHGNPLGPGSSPGPARSCSPQHIHSDSHNRERATQSHSPSSRGHHTHRHQHRSREGSRSHSQRNQDRSGFSCHRRRRDHSHRRSDSKKSDESLERSQHASNPGHSPSQTLLHQSWSGQSPTMSIWNGNECSPIRNNTSSDRSQECSQHVKDRCSQSPSDWEKERGRTRTRKRISKSPDLDSFLDIHHHRYRSRKSHRCHKRRRRSISSSSSDDLHLERSCLDKPSGKRKYKTRHLERAAQRQHKEGTTSKVKRPGHRERRHSRECPQSRSPSVEIIYERRVPDMHWHQRRKKRHRKRQREQRSPTVITIDSDSDRTIDCLDRVMDIIDQTASGGDDEQRDNTAQQNIGATLPSTNTLLESSSPVSHSDLVSPDHMLVLDDCVVDVVDHNSSDALNCTQNTDTNSLDADNLLESVPDPFSVVSVATTPPSDTGLLESILQDLKEFLPGLN
ncbi:E3 ubiquitin-protein ligase Topors-like isoform X2 [Myxocyprinus asiaticus]|uniref:E3 ubiquitin-protein ligase Topors-like isoform X2 n=1 Tax=Myxocyprinus asiaticus TaxID=70543 RepID=UPI002223DA21|nr:E3 ubiquitin-protein ligase Topors-like isoform X2 [Myxocyprinus asiaticus]